MQFVKTVNAIVAILFFLCYAYQLVYLVVPFLKKDKPHKTPQAHRFAVLISARNEEKVLGPLLESIRKQTYDSRLVTVFVVADNCTDKTASLARRAGAVVYERFDSKRVGKGYALSFLLHRINEDYPADRFDAFLVFDADNLLDENYITEINKTYSDGYRIITSYRNSKNYGDNWISAGYALWFLRESQYLNHARMLCHTSCAVSGTGFMFSRDVLTKSNGWNFFLLTEDIQFTVYQVSSGEKIGFCTNAVLYDEQPTSFRQSWNQRLRWAKGYLQVFQNYGKKLIGGIFHGSFSCYDMAMSTMPAFVLTTAAALVNVGGCVYSLLVKGSMRLPVTIALYELRGLYFLLFFMGALAVVSEWRHILAAPFKKILYIFTFPVFMLTYLPISCVALFCKVTWTPIDHNRTKTLAQIHQEQKKFA